MSTEKKKISAGDTLTVGDLTDDYLGAFIEVGEPEGITSRLTLGSIDTGSAFTRLVTKRGEERKAFSRSTSVKVIAPPPTAQPDEPTILGQCIRIEGDDDWLGVVVDPPSESLLIWDTDGYWRLWDYVLRRAGERQIIVSDPPRWPDEMPEYAGIRVDFQAGDTFDRISDMPYGWIATVTLSNGKEWGKVVRHDDDPALHRWDTLGFRADQEIRDWTVFNGDSISGGEEDGNRYTLVEPAEDHDARIRSERYAVVRIEPGEWPDDDTHLREWEWIDSDNDPWWWDSQLGLWRAEFMTSDKPRPLCGPWTRGKRLTGMQEDAS